MIRRYAGWALAAALGLAGGGLGAQSEPVHTSVVVDSNPAVFGMLTALNAAGYSAGLEATGSTSALQQLRIKLREEMQAKPAPALAELRGYYETHQRGDGAQNLAQYVTLALFLGNPPDFTLIVPQAGLPPEAEAVADVVPILREFYQQASVAALWNEAQPQYAVALAHDTELVRTTFSAVDTFFRMPSNYETEQFFVYPDLMIGAGDSDSLSYNGNYYLVANLDLDRRIQDVRHAYLHFKLDPLIGRYPAFIDQVQALVLPAVAKAPALQAQYQHDAQLFVTECLVRAVEIQLDSGTPEQKQSKINTYMADGLVMTQFWYDQLTGYRTDPANFSEFYPYSAFGARLDEIAGTARNTKFAPAASGDNAAVAEPLQAPSLLDQANARFDQHDLPTAAALATAYLKQTNPDRASAYYLLGKVAASQNQAQSAAEQFQLALGSATAAQAHVKTWSNIYLARLYDAQNQRTMAVKYYQAALATADTPVSKGIAENGIKAPYKPEAGRGQ